MTCTCNFEDRNENFRRNLKGPLLTVHIVPVPFTWNSKSRLHDRMILLRDLELTSKPPKYVGKQQVVIRGSGSVSSWDLVLTY
jgi:hypothetical protein